MKIHPAAEIFPLMDEASFESLKADIAKHGQREPIVLWHDGSLLDGRHRHRACEELKIEPGVTTLPKTTDVDPFELVISTNLHRRHLTTSQKSIAAADLANAKRGGQKGNKNSAKSDTKKTKGQICTFVSAAKTLGVSPRSVKSASYVLENASAPVIAAVKSGKVSVSLAKKLVDEVPDEKKQASLVKSKNPKQAIKEFVTPAEDKKPASKPETAKPSKRIKCPCCQGEGAIEPEEKDLGFEEFWAITKDSPPKSRLRKAKADAAKAYPKQIKVLASKGYSDPAGHLKARLRLYVASADGKGKFALQVSSWLNSQRYDDEAATWNDVSEDRKPGAYNEELHGGLKLK